MADVLTKRQRSYNMSRIRGKNTKPERVVRSVIHELGYRFRLHAGHLPGKPDIVFPSRKKVIFVHGCFWHMHRCRYGRVVPQTNPEFWRAKRLANKARDRKNMRNLKSLGWAVLIVWECQIRDRNSLKNRIRNFLSGSVRCCRTAF